ncbi:MAG: hypothetical protein GY777_24670 [Candidatus Brocadiaceae bacterium]|nr:hypothetical protein [Candidatus Brocadiaceae bacterium]
MPTFEYNTRDITGTTVTRNLEETDVKIANNSPDRDGYIPINFSLEPNGIVNRLFWCLLGFEFLIVFLDIYVNHYAGIDISEIRKMVNITREDCLSNWFSSLQAIIVGSTVWLIAFSVRNQKKGINYKKKFYCWAGIGVFFIYLGIDDALRFHERIGTAFKVLFYESNRTSDSGIFSYICEYFPSYLWQAVFGPFFVSAGIFIVWFLWKELHSKKLWFWFLVGIGLYAVAVGLDYVEGLPDKPYEKMGIAGFFSTSNYRIGHMSKALEEFLEMLGTTIFLVVFLKNLSRLSREWKFNIRESAD